MHGYARWHNQGHPVLYTSSSPSLALLEVLVHIDPERFKERTLLQLEFDDHSETVTPAQLVQLLRDAPEDDPEATTRAYGSSWLKEARSLALIVPSIIMPFEDNIILNPMHSKAQRIRITVRERLTLDGHLAKQLIAARADRTT